MSPASSAHPPDRDRRFRRHQHIRQRSEFQEVYDRGRKLNGRHWLVFALARDGQPSRLGIAATRKMGAAVERNRAKRLVRELFRRHPAPPGVDIVVVPRRSVLDAPFSSLEADYVATLARIRPDRAAR